MEFTGLVAYCCSPHIMWTARSLSRIKEYSLEGEEEAQTTVFDVLPAQKMKQNNFSFTPNCSSSLFAYQQDIFIFIHTWDGKLLHTIEVPYRAGHISFATEEYPDFFLLMACSLKKGIIHVWSIPKETSPEEVEEVTRLEFNLRLDQQDINGSPIGRSTEIESVHWIPQESKSSMPNLFIILEDCVSVVVYSLSKRTKKYLPAPTFSKKGVAFHPTISLVAYLHRSDQKDFILVFSTIHWTLISKIESETKQAEDLCWCEDSICVWDTYLVFGIYWYHLTELSPAQYSPSQSQLGIKTLSLSNSLIAIGSYDEYLRILDCINGRVIAREKFGAILPDLYPAVIYKEVISGTSSKYAVQDLPFLIPSRLVGFKKGTNYPQQGVGLVKWSPSSRYIACRNDNMAQSLWIWDMLTGQMSAVMIQERNILNAVWHPNEDRIAFCCGTNNLFLWSENGSSCVPCTEDEEQFQAMDILWNPNGKALVVLGIVNFVLAFLPEELQIQ